MAQLGLTAVRDLSGSAATRASPRAPRPVAVEVPAVWDSYGAEWQIVIRQGIRRLSFHNLPDACRPNASADEVILDPRPALDGETSGAPSLRFVSAPDGTTGWQVEQFSSQLECLGCRCACTPHELTERELHDVGHLGGGIQTTEQISVA